MLGEVLALAQGRVTGGDISAEGFFALLFKFCRKSVGLGNGRTNLGPACSPLCRFLHVLNRDNETSLFSARGGVWCTRVVRFNVQDAFRTVRRWAGLQRMTPSCDNITCFQLRLLGTSQTHGSFPCPSRGTELVTCHLSESQGWAPDTPLCQKGN